MRETIGKTRLGPESALRKKVDVPLSLIAAVPGKYTGPASRTYLYYTDEYKQWVGGLEVDIEPR